MKRFFKLTALAMSVIVLCLSLCSCQYLDDAKANTAVYTDDTKESFTFRGSLYQKLEISDKLSFIMSDVQSDRYVTTADVPVLLSASYGDQMYYDASKGNDPAVFRVFSQAQVYDSRISAALADDLDEYIPEYAVPDGEALYLPDSMITYYVREDQYDTIKAAVDHAVLDHYFTVVYTYNEPGVPYQGGKYLPAILDDDATEVIRRTLDSTQPASWDDLSSSTEWYSIILAVCDKDMLVSDNGSYNSSVTLITNTTDYYLFNMNDAAKLYKVSDEDFYSIRKVYSMCRESLDYFDVDYYRENADKASSAIPDYDIYIDGNAG